VLVREPYYNEAGYDTRSGMAETAGASQHYSEKAFYSSRGFIIHAIQNDVNQLEDVITWLYESDAEGAPQLLDIATRELKTMVDAEGKGDVKIGGLHKVSKGALIVFKRRLGELEKLRDTLPRP
jgi:ubiquitin-conjugating enzyme E2 O